MFWPKFVELCNGKGVSPNAAAKDLSISSSAVTKWKNGARPQDRTLYKVAEYFGVAVDVFDDNDGEIVTTEAEESEDMNILRFALYGDPAQDVTREQLEDVKRYAAYIRERDKEKK